MRHIAERVEMTIRTEQGRKRESRFKLPDTRERDDQSIRIQKRLSFKTMKKNT
jgi:hypothetical protein